jgi:hypothetical protein
MQITSLNRIIATLIIGGTWLIWLLLWHADVLKNEDILKKFADVGNIGSGFIFLVVAIIIGTIIDAITEIFFNQTIIKGARCTRWIAVFFLQHHAYDRFANWLCFFERAITGSKFDLGKTPGMAGIKFDASDVLRLTAVGIFFREAGKENFAWMTASDAVFHLTGSLAVSAAAIWILESCNNAAAFKYLPYVLLFIYFCIGRSINRDLYADTVIFRFSTLFCLSNPPVQSNAALST